jgi:hypothetical protein
MSSDAALLEQFKPFLRYDSNEGYFADSAAEMTDAAGNTLKSADGVAIAAAGGELDLDLLVAAGQRYPGTEVVAAGGDVLSIPDKSYQERYRAVRVASDEYPNVVYGRRKGDWLQYWFWYFYNPLRALDIGLGLHEGDWEGIQLRLVGEEPDLAVYAQHDYGEAREWEHVKKVGDRPVVYVALGSHASYFSNGGWPLHWHRTEHFLDRTDGRVTPAGDLRLEILQDDSPSWVRWPGTWGDTKKPPPGPGPVTEAYKAVSATSPVGPGINKRWDDPQYLLNRAVEVGRAPGVPKPAPPPPMRAPAAPSQLDARVADGKLRVSYEISPKAREEQPTHLLVTVNSPDDPYPPTTYRLELPHATVGTVEVPLDADASQHYDLNASGVTSDGRLSRVVKMAAPATA